MTMNVVSYSLATHAISSAHLATAIAIAIATAVALAIAIDI